VQPDQLVRPIHHISLSVTDLLVSRTWYEQLFGLAQVIERTGLGWQRLRLTWDTGLIIGLTQHESTLAGDFFKPSQIGLDHIGINCTSETQVRSWFNRLQDLAFEHGPFEDVSYGWAVTVRDPDEIPIEFFCPK